MGKVQRTTLLDLNDTSLAQLVPEVSGSQSNVVAFARRLADGPDHAEIAHRRSLRDRCTLQQQYRLLAPGCHPGMRQSDDSSTHDRHVELIHEDSAGRADRRR